MMKVSQENTAIVIQNARAEGQTSRADYMELMDREIVRLQALSMQLSESLKIQLGESARLQDALDALLDGLDVEYEGSRNLRGVSWGERIKHARSVLGRKSDG